MKLTIFHKREFDFVGMQGDQVHGWMYSAFTPENQAIQFTSQRSDIETLRAVKFEKDHCQEIDIEPRVFGGKVKYREVDQKIVQ